MWQKNPKSYQVLDNAGFPKPAAVWEGYMLTIYTNHPGESKTINLTWWENDPLQIIPKSAKRTKE